MSATILIVFIVAKVLLFYLCHHLLYEQITIYSVSYRYCYLAEQTQIFYSGEMIKDVGVTCIRFSTGYHFKQIKLEKADLRSVPYWLEKLWCWMTGHLSSSQPDRFPQAPETVRLDLHQVLLLLRVWLQSIKHVWAASVHARRTQVAFTKANAPMTVITIEYWWIGSFGLLFCFMYLQISSIFLPTLFTSCTSCVLALTDGVTLPPAGFWRPSWVGFLARKSFHVDPVGGLTADPPKARKRLKYEQSVHSQ